MEAFSVNRKMKRYFFLFFCFFWFFQFFFIIFLLLALCRTIKGSTALFSLCQMRLISTCNRSAAERFLFLKTSDNKWISEEKRARDDVERDVETREVRATVSAVSAASPTVVQAASVAVGIIYLANTIAQQLDNKVFFIFIPLFFLFLFFNFYRFTNGFQMRKTQREPLPTLMK